MKKKIKIQNAAIMKRDGTYTRETIPPDKFFNEIENADEIESYIGYSQNAHIIEDKTGREIPLSREILELEDEDEYLAMVLKYRTNGGKGQNVNPENFEYLRIKFKK
jgi:hypothetical protein